MNSKQIERVLSIGECLYISMVSLIPGIFLFTFTAQSGQGGSVGFFLIPTGVAIAVLSWRSYVSSQLAKHIAELGTLATTYGWRAGDPVIDADAIGEAFGRMSLGLLAQHGQKFHTYVAGPGWDYTDWSYEWFQKVKNGEFKGADIYYGVMSAKLPRIMPNVFFDSKSERGRQFKAKFTADQRHSLEGDFDNYFDTYFAEGYTIDSMSFITPDVMEQLENASAYDIEIVEDRVLLYGPVYTDSTVVQDMAAKLLAVQKELAENANTYRDDRLSGAARATTVTPRGMFLRRRGRSWIWTAMVIAIYLAMYLFRVWLQ